MSDKKKPNRRDFIFTATAAVGAVGAGAAAWPLIDQMNPDASVKALASTEVDVSSLQPGQSITVLWRGKPVFIKRRTERLVMLGVCTHLGCVPLADKGEYGGWFCPCHGSHYDTAGRIRKGPAPTNLEIPKYEFVDSNTIKIG